MCRAPKRALVSFDFWFSGAEPDFSALIQFWRATCGQVRSGPPLPRPRDVSVPSRPRFPHFHTRTLPSSRVDSPPCTPSHHLRSPFVSSYPWFNLPNGQKTACAVKKTNVVGVGYHSVGCGLRRSARFVSCTGRTIS
jgi:hypothetical protein